jgi:phosphate starvation-inducible PhoH-like protein
LTRIEAALDVLIAPRGNRLAISGTPGDRVLAKSVLDRLHMRLELGLPIDANEVEGAIRMARSDGRGAPRPAAEGAAAERATLIRTPKRLVAPRSAQQGVYVDAMRESDLVFGLGPAGTGKTFLAVAMAVSLFRARHVERIVLSRPAVEAGERLGFLPGDMKEKVDPYLRPLYDALHDTLGGEETKRRLADDDIEIAPLAFMRGRTLSNAFVILDEAQNATSGQMKMFLTRLGENSRMVITGDPSQVDLPPGVPSGLVEASQILTGVDGVAEVRFSSADVVRHPLVARIVGAYDAKAQAAKRAKQNANESRGEQ